MDLRRHRTNWPLRSRAILDALPLTEEDTDAIKRFLRELRDNWPPEAEGLAPMPDVFRAVAALESGTSLKDALWFINQKLERRRQLEIRTMDQDRVSVGHILPATPPYGGASARGPSRRSWPTRPTCP